MPIYDRPTKVLMHEWADEHLKPGQTFSKREPVEWFKERYPRIKSNTVQMHIEGMSTNNARHRSHHPSVHAGSGHDLFFKIGPGLFRLYDPQTDPAPVYDLESNKTSQGQADEDAPEIDEQLDETTLSAAREFAYERDLQNYLVKNLETLEPGLRIYDDPEEEIIGIEFQAGGRRIDILAVDSDDHFVVVELKVSKGYDRVIGQLARYMAWVKKNMDTAKPVRGIIVANSISEDLKLAASLIDHVDLIEYSMKFEIRRVDRQL